MSACTSSTSATRTTRRGRCAAGSCTKLSGAPFEEMHRRRSPAARPTPTYRAFSPTGAGAVPARRRRRRLGFARDRRVPGRAASGHVARRTPTARAWARSIASRDALGLRGAAQRHDDVHPRARRRAAVVGGARARTSRASRRSGTRARAPLRQRRPVSCAARSRSPTRSTRRWRSASRPTALRRTARPASTCAALLAHPLLREWEAAALAETAIIEADEPRIIYRDKLAAARLALCDRGGRDDRPTLGRGRSASARRRRAHEPLRIRGGGTKDFYGERARRRRARARAAYAGIVDYEPTELVITARAGTPLAEIEKRDARRAARCSRSSRRISAPGATLGGAVAAGLVRPAPALCRRGARPRARRARCSTARGEDLAFGGRVMKNVAGFDVARLMTRRARHARHHHRGLAQVPAAAAGRSDARVRAVGRRGDPPRQRMGRAAAAAVGDVLSRRAACRCGCPGAEPAVDAAVARARRRAVEPTAPRSGARCAITRIRSSRGAREAGTALWRLSVQLDGAVRGSRRRAADRMGRRAALARRRRARRPGAGARLGRGARRPCDAVSRRRQVGRRLPSARRAAARDRTSG